MAARSSDFVGTWRLISAVQNGRDVTALCDAEVVYWLDGEHLRMKSTGGSVEGTCHLDPSHDPAHLDLSYEWEGQTLVTRGICRLDGDRLTVCLGGSQRPDSFDVTIPDGRTVFVYERL